MNTVIPSFMFYIFSKINFRKVNNYENFKKQREFYNLEISLMCYKIWYFINSIPSHYVHNATCQDLKMTFRLTCSKRQQPSTYLGQTSFLTVTAHCHFFYCHIEFWGSKASGRD